MARAIAQEAEVQLVLLIEMIERAAEDESALEGGEFVLDLFAGTASALVALLLEGGVVSHYKWVELDSASALVIVPTVKWALENFEGQVNHVTFRDSFSCRDVNQLSWADLVIDNTPVSLVPCGSPCQGFSRAPEVSLGLAHPGSVLLLRALDIIDMVRVLNSEAVYVFENVNIGETHPDVLEYLESRLGTVGALSDAAWVQPSHRLRYWNVNVRGIPWPHEDVGISWGEALHRAGEGHEPQWCYNDDHFPMAEINVFGEPVKKTFTFMASDTNTRTMRLPPKGTGTGLVWSEAEGCSVPPGPMAVALGMSVPEDLAREIVSTGIPASLYRGKLGNAMSVRVLQLILGRVLEARKEWGGIIPPPVPGVPEERERGAYRLRSLDDWDDGEMLLPDTSKRMYEGERRGAEAPLGAEQLTSDFSQLGNAEHVDEAELDHMEGMLWESIGEDLLSVDHLPKGGGGFAELGKPYSEHIAQNSGDALDKDYDPPPDVEALKQELRSIIGELRRVQLGESSPSLGSEWTTEQLNTHLQNLMDGSLNGKHFQANRYSMHAEVWEELFKLMKELGLQEPELTKPQKKVLGVVKTGYRMEFQKLSKMATDGRPRAAKKKRAVERLLSKVVGRDRIHEFLKEDSDEPRPVHFPNHATCEPHTEFIRTTRDELVKSGALKKWFDLPWHIHKGKPPWLVHPFAVAFSESKNKYRLCTDMRYLNLWLKYIPFKFESLEDLLAIIRLMQEGGNQVFLCLSDMKSGYHHLGIDPAFWTYCAVVIDGEYYVYTVVSFGMTTAVQLYSQVEGEKHRCLRALGLKMVQYIDDRCSPYTSTGEALFYESKIVRIVTLLGGYLSFGDVTYEEGQIRFSKMQLFPLREAVFLGIQVEVHSGGELWIRIPAKKIEYFKKVTRELLAKTECTPREKAKFTGLTMSFLPAIRPGRLHVRAMFKALTGEVSWDSPEAIQVTERHVMQQWLDKVDEWNGARGSRPPVVLTIAADASVELGAAYTVEKSFYDGQKEYPTIVTMSKEQSLTGSAVREVIVIRLAVETAVQTYGAKKLRGFTVRYLGDNEGLCFALEGWGAHTDRLSAEILELWELLLKFGIEFQAVWQPRTSPELKHADWLGKEGAIDPSSWELCNAESTRIIKRCKAIIGRTPTADGMADHFNAKARVFFSKERCPGSAGVDFFEHTATLAGLDEDTGEKHLVWLNGDFSKMRQILLAIGVAKMDVILVYPVWPAPWKDLLDFLPIISGPHLIPNRPRLFKAGPRVEKTDTERTRFRVAWVLIVHP